MSDQAIRKAKLRQLQRELAEKEARRTDRLCSVFVWTFGIATGVFFALGLAAGVAGLLGFSG